MSKKDFVITEGVEGYWQYHFSNPGKTSRSLCGKATMQTEMTHEQWGFVGHLNEKYCSECEKLADQGVKITLKTSELPRWNNIAIIGKGSN